MSRSPARRWAPVGLLVALLVALLAALLPLGLAAPAQASPGCKQEGQLLACDDTSPPLFTAAAMTVNVANGVATVAAQAIYGDTDTDPIAYQCALDSGAFGPCGSFPGLATGAHTMKVRALDAHDAPIVACELLLCAPLYVESAPDYTDAQKQFTVTPGGSAPPGPGPGGAPETQITGGPQDKITPGQPVSLSRRPTVVLSASEPATFRCAINAQKVPCKGGVTVLDKLKPGTQVFVAQAVDKDGNFDRTPARLTFYVPHNLAPGKSKGWKSVKSRGSYAGDYVSTSRKGALLTLGAVRGVREVRLIAPVGPELGKIAIRVGKGSWMKVWLRSSKSQKLHVFELRGVGSRRLSGVIQVKALKVPAGGAVAVDAIVAR